MAIRSLLLSLAVTSFLGYSFTVGLTDQHSFLKKLPDWLGIPLLLLCGLLYLLAAWWAIRGFSDHKLSAIVSLGLCAFGLGIYATGFAMVMGRGKASSGQYDYDFATLNPTEKAVMAQIAHEAGLGLENAVFTEHWNMVKAAESPATNKGFGICVQQGHITALNLSNHPVPNLKFFSRLPNLSDLYLINCGLSEMSGLRSDKLDRLDVSDNHITDLKTLRGCPNIQWLFARNNRLTSTDGLAQFRTIISTDFSGNPLPN